MIVRYDGSYASRTVWYSIEYDKESITVSLHKINPLNPGYLDLDAESVVSLTMTREEFSRFFKVLNLVENDNE